MQEAISSGHKFKILGPSSREVGIEKDSIGDFGHQYHAKAHGEPMVVVLQDGAIGVPARVRGVVVRTIVVHSPIQELQMAVGTPGVCVKEIDEPELADAKLEAAGGKRGRQAKWSALGGNTVVAEGNDLAHHRACKIGNKTQLGVTHDVKIGEPRQSKGCAEAMTSGAFDIHEDFCRVRELVTEVKRINFRRGVLRFGVETVWAAVFRREGRMPLKDNVGLARNPERGSVRMRKERQYISGIGIFLSGDRGRILSARQAGIIGF